MYSYYYYKWFAYILVNYGYTHILFNILYNVYLLYIF